MLKNANDGLGIALQLRQRHPFVGGVGLCNIARAIHKCGQAGLRKQLGFSPEIHRVAHWQLQRFGQCLRRLPARLGITGIPRRQ